MSVAFGVAMFLAVSAGTRAVSDALDRPADLRVPGASSGALVLQPSGVFGADARASAVDGLRELPQVRSVHATYNVLVEAELENGRSQMDAYGLDAGVLESIPLAAGRAPGPGADEMAVPEGFFGSDASVIGETAELVGSGGAWEARITGLTRSDATRAFGVVTSIETARRWGGANDAVSVAVVQLEPGIDPVEWAEDHREDLGPLQPPPELLFASDAAEFFRETEGALAPVASAALLIGGYLIFLSVSRTVHDRRRVHATFRALGGSRRQLVGLVVAEAAAVGAVATVVGVGLGLVLARVVAEGMSGAFRLNLAVEPSVTASSPTLAAAVVLGLLTPVVASITPAMRAAREDPATGLRGAATDTGPSSRSAAAGSALVVVGLGLTAGLAELLKPIGMVVALGGVILVAPMAARGVAATTATAWARVSPVSGALAAQRLARRPGRATTTAGLLAVCLALVFVVATLRASGRPGFEEVVETHFRADLVVADYTNRGLDPQIVEALSGVPGTAGVTEGAAGWAVLLDRGGRTEFMTVVDPTAYRRVSDFAWTVETDPQEAWRRLNGGGHVLLEQSIARRVNRSVGDIVSLQTANGPHAFAVAGTYAGLPYGNSRAVVVSVEDARRHFGYARPTRLAVQLEPGADAETTVARMHDAVPTALSGRSFIIERNDVFRADALATFDGAWNGVTVLIGTTVLVALLGLATTLVMEMLDRRHELGILRAIGASRRDVAGLVVAEALTLSLTGGLVGVLAGTALGRAAVARVTLDTGVPQPFYFPAAMIAPLLVAATIVGVVAAILPARHTASLDPAEVLRLPAT
ncbi:MAG TPA: FtsX-like permease family protein [Acidimicrobiia bacterium]|nr:FtsX-like permease family protein [Acidimicrobiia bacterium]